MRLLKKNRTRNFKKQLLFITTLFLYGSINVALSDNYPKASYAMKKIIGCLNNPLLSECQNIILYTEAMQLRAYNRGEFRCQTSLLGAQTELIRLIYLTKNKNDITKISIPFVIKNCKL